MVNTKPKNIILLQILWMSVTFRHKENHNWQSRKGICLFSASFHLVISFGAGRKLLHALLEFKLEIGVIAGFRGIKTGFGDFGGSRRWNIPCCNLQMQRNHRIHLRLIAAILINNSLSRADGWLPKSCVGRSTVCGTGRRTQNPYFTTSITVTITHSSR